MHKVMKVLLFSDTWVTLAVGMLGPIYALFVQEIGGSILAASWAYSAFLFTSGVIMFVLSKWEDRIKNMNKVVIAGYALTSVGILGYIFVYNALTLIFVQVILGFAEALLIPAFDAVYSDFLDKEEETSEWGAEEAINYIFTAVGAVIGGYIAHSFGFNALFIVMFAFSLVSLFSSFTLLKKEYND